MSVDIQALSANLSTSEEEIANLQQQAVNLLSLSQELGANLHQEIDGEDYKIAQLRTENLKLRHRLTILSKAIKVEDSKRSSTMQQGSSIQDVLHDLFKGGISGAFPDLPDAPVVITLSGNNPAFGDYQLNSAMQIANIYKQKNWKVSARDIAKKILLHTGKSPFVEKTEVAGAGFINIWLSKSYGQQMLNSMLREGIQPPCIKKKYRVVVDFSSPNIAKEMHVGHLRSTIIGESICRLLEFLGHSVLRLNHVGDWGTQFGMLIAHLQDEFPDYLVKAPPISDLQTFYKESKRRFDEEEVFKKRAYECVVKLQGFDDNFIKAWQMICDVSRREFQSIYERLKIRVTERGESFYQTRMVAIVGQLRSQGLLEEDEGRHIMWPSSDDSQPSRGIPMTIVKSDGGYTYDTSDMATIKQRIEEERADWLVYVTDMGQATHFDLLFACARRAGVLRPQDVRVDHVGFGVVLGEDKKKFKTRSGETVRLTDLLDEGVKRSMDKLREKNRYKELSAEEMQRASEAIAYGCIKYADLSHNRNAEYVFSFDKMLEDKGNTAVYLLYALTRIRSIARNADMEFSKFSEVQEKATGEWSVSVAHAKEWKLGRVLLRFPDVVRKVAVDLHVHHLCEYVYEVATVFTEFYDACYCIERDGSGAVTAVHHARLHLVQLTANMMDKCLGLLGIDTIDKM